MILSLNLFAFKGGKPNISDFEMAKRAGYSDITIEFNDSKDDPLLNDDYETKVIELKSVLCSMDLTVSQTHLKCYSFAVGSTIKSEERDEMIKRSIIGTKILGCPWGAIHPRTSLDAIYDRDYNLKENVKFLEPLLKVAEEYKVGIAVENIATWRDAEKNKYFSSYHQELIDLIDYFNGNKYIGICWDTGHANLNMHCEDQFEAIRQIGHRLKTIHLASNDGRYDDHLMPPAFGTVDCGKLASVLKEIKYDGVLSCELHGTELPETNDSYFKLNCVCGEYIMGLLK